MGKGGEERMDAGPSHSRPKLYYVPAAGIVLLAFEYGNKLENYDCSFAIASSGDITTLLDRLHIIFSSRDESDVE